MAPFHKHAVGYIISCLNEEGPRRDFQIRTYIRFRYDRRCEFCRNIASIENVYPLREQLDLLEDIGAVTYTRETNLYQLPTSPLLPHPVIERKKSDLPEPSIPSKKHRSRSRSRSSAAPRSTEG